MKVKWVALTDYLFVYLVNGVVLHKCWPVPGGDESWFLKSHLTGVEHTFSSLEFAKSVAEEETKIWAASYLAAVACQPGSSDGSDGSDKSGCGGPQEACGLRGCAECGA